MLLAALSLFGASPAGFVLSGALLSQVVSNVPAALLLAALALSLALVKYSGSSR